MDSEEFDSLYFRLVDLSLKQVVWPSPCEMMYYADKWNLIRDLDKIVEPSSHTRPSSVLLEYGCAPCLLAGCSSVHIHTVRNTWFCLRTAAVDNGVSTCKVMQQSHIGFVGYVRILHPCFSMANSAPSSSMAKLTGQRSRAP